MSETDPFAGGIEAPVDDPFAGADAEFQQASDPLSGDAPPLVNREGEVVAEALVTEVPVEATQVQPTEEEMLAYAESEREREEALAAQAKAWAHELSYADLEAYITEAEANGGDETYVTAAKAEMDQRNAGRPTQEAPATAAAVEAQPAPQESPAPAPVTAPTDAGPTPAPATPEEPEGPTESTSSEELGAEAGSEVTPGQTGTAPAEVGPTGQTSEESTAPTSGEPAEDKASSSLAPEPEEKKDKKGGVTHRRYLIFRPEGSGVWREVTWFEKNGKMVKQGTPGAKKQRVALGKSQEEALEVGYRAMGSPEGGCKLVAVSKTYFQTRHVEPEEEIPQPKMRLKFRDA